jgi:WD40 repeat protein
MMIDPAVIPTVDTGSVDVENPWPGLAAFREADQFFFQGRETVVEELTRMVLRARLTVLHGVSGLGKTSVLRAGLFPRLRREHLLPIYVRLGHSEETAEPIEQVREAIARGARSAAVEAPVPKGDETLWEYFHHRGAQFWDARNRIVTPLLVFDQFEELFTLGIANAQRRARTHAFVSELSDLVEGRPASHVRARLERDPEEALRFSMSDQPCKVLLSLREDFLPDLAEMRRSMPAITDTMYRLRPMTTAEGLRVVEVGGRLIDHDVAEKVVDFVASARLEHGTEASDAVVEPALLSVFCRELNNKRRANGADRITADLLQGSRTAIIADFYERTISEGGLSPAVRMFVEDRLLTESGFRNSEAEEQALHTGGITPADIETLIARRLLRREDAGTRERSRLELTHDVLADAVRTSRDRRRAREHHEREIATRRDREEKLRREAEEAAARQQQQREFEAARALAATQQKAAALASALALEEQKGREAAEHLARVERRTRKRQIAYLSVVLLAIAALAAVALVAARRASRAEGDAKSALSASYVDRVAEGEPWALPLLARAVRMDPDSTMARALLVGHLSRQVLERTAIAVDARVRSATLNTAGTRILTMSGSGTARLWNSQSGEPVAGPLGQAEHTTTASFSPDGTRVVTASEDGTARLFDASSAEPIGNAIHHQGRVNSASFDRTGRRIVTASDDRKIRLWNLENGNLIEIVAASGPIVEATFDSTATFVLSVSADGDATIWNTASGVAVSRFGPGRGDAAAVTNASFSPDGSRIVAVLTDGTARVIDTRTGRPVGNALEEPVEPANESRGIVSARFDPAGARVLTTSIPAGVNGQGSIAVARLWDTATGALLPATMKHTAWISTAVFSPDGSLVLTGSRDGSARVWNATTGSPLGGALHHARPVVSASFSPDGSRVLTASDDGTAQLWDAQTGVENGAALRHDGPVTSAAFSSDGRTIVTAALDRVRTWDARTGVILETTIRHAEGLIVTLASMSPDATYVATAGNLDPYLSDAERTRRADEGHAVRVWEVATGHPIGEPLTHAGPVNSVKFSRAGARLVTASDDGTARIWNATRAAPIGDVLRHRGPVFSAAFDAAGTRVITASADGTARIWDAESGRSLIELNHCDKGSCAEVRSAAFNPDGSRVVTGASDGNVRLWDAATGALMKTSAFQCAILPDSRGAAAPVSSVSFSPDSARILTSSDRESRVWDAANLAPVQPCLDHEGAPNLPVFGRDASRNELQIVTTSTSDGARVWDVWQEPVVRWVLARDRAVMSASFSGDGRLVTASQSGTARIWNVRTGKETGLALSHPVGLRWTQFSVDGARILMLTADGTVRIWDMPAGGRQDAEALVDLAEAVSGHALDASGVRHLDSTGVLASLRNGATGKTSSDSFAGALARWLFADPATRTISPLSRITVPEYVSRMRGNPSSVGEAVAPLPERPR